MLKRLIARFALGGYIRRACHYRRVLDAWRNQPVEISRMEAAWLRVHVNIARIRLLDYQARYFLNESQLPDELRDDIAALLQSPMRAEIWNKVRQV